MSCPPPYIKQLFVSPSLIHLLLFQQLLRQCRRCSFVLCAHKFCLKKKKKENKSTARMMSLPVPSVLSILVLLFANVQAGSYIITGPQNIQPGEDYVIGVKIVNATDVLVQATLQEQVYNGLSGRFEPRIIVNTSGVFGSDQPGKLVLPIEPTLSCSNCQVLVRGSRGLQFEQVLYTSVSSQVTVILIQTDKALYKPGQLVRYRTFAVYPDLSLYEGGFSIEIRDPNNNKIRVLTNVSSSSGVVESDLKLSEQPVFGQWTISVSLTDVTESYSQTFDVAAYVLPRFEVTVELPPYGLVNDDVINGKVTARYNFGKPVKGYVELHVGPNQGPNSCGDLPRSTQIGFEINGEATFSVPKEDIERAVRLYNNQEVRFTAFVKEDNTGVRLNGSKVLTFYVNKYQVKFTDNTPSVFKAGLPYTAYIQVTTPDNKPPTDNNITVSVYTSVSYQLTVPDQSLYDTFQFSGTYGLPGRNETLPASGLLAVDIDIPQNATSITIKATVKDVQTTKTVEKMYSPSNNFIQLTLLNKNVKAGSTVVFRADGTEPLNEIVYQVLARGAVAISGTLNGNGQKSFTFSLDITPELAPTSHLLVYYTRGSDEIIADSLAFNVEGIFKNEVTISFSRNESEPGQNVSLEVSATPESYVYVLAVDQGVLNLKTGNDITADKVKTGLEKFDRAEKPSGSEFALSLSATNVQEVFSKLGLLILTDIAILYPPRPVYTSARFMPASLNLAGPPGQYGPPQPYAAPRSLSLKSKMADVAAPLKTVEKIRQLFPEVWLFSDTYVSENGTASIPAIVPDTITSWIASAFATHPTAGLGVAASTAKLTVFRSFFVSLTVPTSVIRGEQVVIQAVVFNYLQSTLKVVVTLKGSSQFESVIPRRGGLEVLESGSQIREVEVKSGEQGVVNFPIHASTLGLIDIEVTAQTPVSADGEIRQILVKPEGAPVSYNNIIFVNQDAAGNFQDTIEFPLPPSVVNGSDRARVKATGDLIGSSLDSLTSLIQLPSGCGEQSMVHFAPDIYIAQYLLTTGQLTAGIKREILDFLQEGYQRQLTYQRTDGSFSAFGNSDEAGSTWLTSYVARVLYQAQVFIYIDPRVLVRAIDWLVERQNKDGSFNEFGRVLDSSTQGAGSGPALTAFVLQALITNSPLSPIDCFGNADCYRTYQWGNATQKAIKFLEGLVEKNAISDQFTLSVVSHSLTLANSTRSDEALRKLETFARREGGLLFWADNSTIQDSQGSEYLRSWRPPRPQSRPINILITSYAILAYTAKGQLEAAFPAVRWLTSQRNPSGGFASSQDTSVGLQALAAYASKSIRPDTNLAIKVATDVRTVDFVITQANALVLQIQELNKAPSKAEVSATGPGLAMIEIEVSFHTNKQLSTPSFDVSTVLLDDDLDSFNVMVCSKWLWDWESGMVVQEISIPSGFNPDLGTLGNVAGLKRSERRGDTVNIYFDKLSKTSVCYSIQMIRTDKIARTQENYIRTWSYYNPRDQSTVFWQPRKLRDSTVCDVCDECCS